MGLKIVQVIEDDTLTRDAIFLYLGKDAETRLTWMGSHDQFVQRSVFSPCTHIIVGQQWGQKISRSLETLERGSVPLNLASGQREPQMAHPYIICLSQHAEKEDVEFIEKHSSVRALIDKAEVGRNLLGLVNSVNHEELLVTARLASELKHEGELLSKLSIKTAYTVPELDLSNQLMSIVVMFSVFGFSCEHIAHYYDISVGVVHSRLRSAYRILGVNNRQEAYERLASIMQMEY